jgi:hypothetical protein
MMRSLRARRVGIVVVIGAGVVAFYGCSAVLGLGDYAVGPLDGGGDVNASETSGDGGDGGDGAPNCNVDITKVCYPCDPGTNDQFLNSCPDNTCIPFDPSRINGLLLSDGGLPPLDGG